MNRIQASIDQMRPLFEAKTAEELARLLEISNMGDAQEHELHKVMVQTAHMSGIIDLDEALSLTGILAEFYTDENRGYVTKDLPSRAVEMKVVEELLRASGLAPR